MISLIIETSTERGIVALFKNDELIFEGKLPFGLQNSKSLFPEIVKAFALTNLSPSDLKYIVAGIGPGSYTGIRVGAMTAKTFGFALNIPLIGICSLNGFVPEEDGHFASVMDARIGGVYLQEGVKKGDSVTWLTKPMLVPLNEAMELLKDIKILVTPSSSLLKSKFENLAKNNEWNWIETDPFSPQIYLEAKEKYENKEFLHDQQLDLLYLRKTQAEIETNR